MKKMKQIVVFGSSGAIGNAFSMALAQRYPDAVIHCFSRQSQDPLHPKQRCYSIDTFDETSLKQSAEDIRQIGSLDMLIVATGVLHQGDIKPEKSLNDLSEEKLLTLYKVNTILPTLILKHFLPILSKTSFSTCVVLSARLGSISDNRLGGWYSYRASKAALNMVIKTASIEIKRRNPHAIVVGLHPGTVQSPLSAPYSQNVSESKLFTPQLSVEKMLSVLDTVTPEDSGKCFAWDGNEVLP